MLEYIKTLNNNYTYAFNIDQNLVIVDPGEAGPVIEYITNSKYTFKAILLTHKHDDHIGGVKELKELYPSILIIGPDEIAKTLKIDKIVDKDEVFNLFGEKIISIFTPGHTEGHSCYVVRDMLFSGDCLFSFGCGRVFTNDYQAMYKSLAKLSILDDNLLLCAGHEYTLDNINFLLSELDNSSEEYLYLNNYKSQVENLLKDGKASLPVKLKNEKKYNLFLTSNTFEEFLKLRELKNKF
ncbi:MAG: hydroxyacylglutathione hydrolase [Psittacicella sp.]